MTLAPTEIADRFPLPVYNFRVTVDATAISFTEVSGIHLEYETLAYRHGLSAWEGERISKFRYDKFIPITFKKGIVHHGADLYQWLQECQGTRSIEVSLCDEQGKPLVTWRLRRAVAVKLDAPTFDASSNDVAIESLELMASGITVVHH